MNEELIDLLDFVCINENVDIENVFATLKADSDSFNKFLAETGLAQTPEAQEIRKLLVQYERRSFDSNKGLKSDKFVINSKVGVIINMAWPYVSFSRELESLFIHDLTKLLQLEEGELLDYKFIEGCTIFSATLPYRKFSRLIEVKQTLDSGLPPKGSFSKEVYKFIHYFKIRVLRFSL